MEEKSMMKMEEVKEGKVEIIKDINILTESEKELAEKKEQEKKERKFLIQLIIVFCTWIFLIILVLSNKKIVPTKEMSLSIPANLFSKKGQQKSNTQKTPKATLTPSTKAPNPQNKFPKASTQNQPGKQQIPPQQHNSQKQTKKSELNK